MTDVPSALKSTVWTCCQTQVRRAPTGTRHRRERSNACTPSARNAPRWHRYCTAPLAGHSDDERTQTPRRSDAKKTQIQYRYRTTPTAPTPHPPPTYTAPTRHTAPAVPATQPTTPSTLTPFRTPSPFPPLVTPLHPIHPCTLQPYSGALVLPYWESIVCIRPPSPTVLSTPFFSNELALKKSEANSPSPASGVVRHVAGVSR